MKRLFKFIILIAIVLTIYYVPKYLKNSKITKLLTDNYEPKYLINNLYKSKEINYRLLNNDEKKLYDIVITNISNFEPSFKIDLSNYQNEYSYGDIISKYINLVLNDHPELIQFGSAEFIRNSNNDIDITIKYVMDKNAYDSNIIFIKEQIDNVKNNTHKLNEYEKIKYVYEYLGNKNRYGDPKDLMAQSAFSAFNDSLSPVCAGYARASQILFNNIGIDSLLVSGYLKSSLFFGDRHAWNVVKIDNKYYNYDVTQSSISKKDISYIGLLPTNKHQFKPNYKKSYPYIYSTKYDYYKMNNLIYKYNINKIKDMVLNSNKKLIEIKITNFNIMYLNEIAKEIPNYNIYSVDNILFIEKN